jgi:hypothetical protein
MNAEAAPPVFPNPDTYVMVAVPLALLVFGVTVSYIFVQVGEAFAGGE